MQERGRGGRGWRSLLPSTRSSSSRDAKTEATPGFRNRLVRLGKDGQGRTLPCAMLRGTCDLGCLLECGRGGHHATRSLPANLSWSLRMSAKQARSSLAIDRNGLIGSLVEITAAASAMPISIP